MSLPSEEIEKSRNNVDVTPTVEHVQSIDHDDDGKLEELEVDIAAVLQEDGDFGVESQQSPLPEGESRIFSDCGDQVLTERYLSPCSCTKC